MISRILSIMMLMGCAASAQALHVGTGISSTTGGRPTPVLTGGFYLGQSALLSGMTTGTHTKAYYYNSYALNLTFNSSFGKGWAGEIVAGIGAGAFYNESGLIEVDQEGNEENVNKDRNGGAGPAFRVIYFPFRPFYMGVEYVMGVGWSAIINAWGALGMFTIGVEL